MTIIEDCIVPLQPMMEEAYDRAVEADWEGDTRAASLWSEYRRLKAKVDKGELYEPRF